MTKRKNLTAEENEVRLEKRRAESKAYYWANRERIISDRKKDPEKRIPRNERVRDSYRNNPEKRRKKWASDSLRKLYGITELQYMKMFEQQNGCCAMCGISQDKLEKRLSVDHCHKSGKVRGLLCPICNFALGKYEIYKDSCEEYLKTYPQGPELMITC